MLWCLVESGVALSDMAVRRSAYDYFLTVRWHDSLFRRNYSVYSAINAPSRSWEIISGKLTRKIDMMGHAVRNDRSMPAWIPVIFTIVLVSSRAGCDICLEERFSGTSSSQFKRISQEFLEERFVFGLLNVVGNGRNRIFTSCNSR